MFQLIQPSRPRTHGGQDSSKTFNGDIQRTAFIGRLAIAISLLARLILQEIFGCVGQGGYIEPPTTCGLRLQYQYPVYIYCRLLVSRVLLIWYFGTHLDKRKDRSLR